MQASFTACPLACMPVCPHTRLTLPNVGTIKTLTIGHNNMGPGPEWHLQMVEVVDEPAARHYFFFCDKWLALGMEDGVLERTLVASDLDPRKHYADYKVGGKG